MQCTKDFETLNSYCNRVLKLIRGNFEEFILQEYNDKNDLNIDINALNESLDFFSFNGDVDKIVANGVCIDQFEQKRLLKTRSEIADEIADCDSQIKDLSARFESMETGEKDVKIHAEADIKKRTEDSQQKIKAMWKNYEEVEINEANKIFKGRKTEAEKATKKYRDEIENSISLKNYDNESMLYAKKLKLENEIREWIDRYDSEMTTKQIELDELNKKLESVAAKKSEVDEEISEIEPVYKEIIKKQQKALKIKNAIKSQNERFEKASLRLQTVTKTFLVRKKLYSKKSTSKKNKKGSKKLKK